MRTPLISKTLNRKVYFTCIGFTLSWLLTAGVIGIRSGRAQAQPEYRNQAEPEYRNQAQPEYRNQAQPEYRNQAQPEYRNQNLPIEQRVADLLSRMTVEEKVAQAVTLWDRKPQQKARDVTLPAAGH